MLRFAHVLRLCGPSPKPTVTLQHCNVVLIFNQNDRHPYPTQNCRNDPEICSRLYSSSDPTAVAVHADGNRASGRKAGQDDGEEQVSLGTSDRLLKHSTLALPDDAFDIDSTHPRPGKE